MKSTTGNLSQTLLLALLAGAVEYADCTAPPHNEATCRPWVVTRDDYGRDPGG